MQHTHERCQRVGAMARQAGDGDEGRDTWGLVCLGPFEPDQKARGLLCHVGAGCMVTGIKSRRGGWRDVALA